MTGWKFHGSMFASALLAVHGVEPVRAEPPRPIPLATSAGDPRLPSTAVPVASPPQSARPFSLWADVLGLSSPSTATSPTPTSPPRVPSLPISSSVRWEVLGRSVEGRVIEFAQFGTGGHQVLVLGALEGDQPEGVAMAEYLAAHLARFPKRLDDVTVTIVRDPNPDGRARRTATNARGVLLDRNFNTPGWKRHTAVTGPEPDSEPEVRGLAELLLDVQPERVVLFGSAAGKASLAFTGPDEPWAKQVALEANAQLQSPDTLRIPGSFASYTGDDRGIPTLRMSFVPAANGDQIWSDHKRAILTAIGCGSPLEFLPLVARYGPRKPRQTTGVPIAQPLMPLAGAVPPSAPPPEASVPQASPEVLRYDTLTQGLPTVKIDRTRVRRTTQSAFDEFRPNEALVSSGAPAVGIAPLVPIAPQMQPASPLDTPIVAAPVSSPVIQRLPPIDAVAPPALPRMSPSWPLVSYPSTGS